MNNYKEALEKARHELGSFSAIGNVCGVSGKAVEKWLKSGRPPRTEYSGETQYAAAISAALAKKGVKIKKAALLPKL